MEQHPRTPTAPDMSQNEVMDDIFCDEVAMETDASASGSSDPEITNFKNLHDEAYLYVDMGLTCDGQGQAEQAVILYNKGLTCLHQALQTDASLPHCTGLRWEQIRSLMKKMKTTTGRIQSRKDFLVANDASAARMINDPPPTYEVSLSSMGSDQADSMNSPTTSEPPQDATALLVIPDGVQLFFITREGAVSAPSYPTSLAVYVFNEQAAALSSPAPAFLQVGEWVYPLLPGRSPVLRSDYGAYMFPDVNTEQQGCSVGLMIPSDVAAEQHSLLDDLLHSFTAFRATTDEKPSSPSKLPPKRPPVPDVQPCRRASEPARPSPPSSHQTVARQQQAQGQEEPTSLTISKGIVTGAEWISWGLSKGAEKTGQLMKKGSTKIKQSIAPATNPKQIDPRYQQAAHVTKQVAGAAVTVSGFVISALGKATMAIAREAAPHIKEHGSKILPQSLKTQDTSGRSKLDDIATVAAGGLAGFGTVYMGLESAAGILAKSLADETVTVVQHRYGKPSGELTGNCLYAVGGAAMAGYNLSAIGVKAIAKRTAKDMGKATIEHMDEKANPNKKKPKGEDEEDDPTP